MTDKWLVTVYYQHTGTDIDQYKNRYEMFVTDKHPSTYMADEIEECKLLGPSFEPILINAIKHNND